MKIIICANYLQAWSLRKSPTDLKNYQLHTLSNGIKLLHVEDKSSSSCAIVVKLNTGSFFDPEICPGLAHLLEHCLFTGSKKFPDDNTLTQFLDAHQGQLNAWTAAESSAYYFKVHSPFFSEALEMFFDMLLQPLFSKSGIEKELSTIDSEFKNKITEEQRRILDVQKQTANPAHPFSRFSVGNNDIFKCFSTAELQSLLRDFWQKIFVADNISVCITTPQQGAGDIRKASQKLQQFPKTKPPKISLPELYLEEHLNKHIRIHTKRTHHRLILIFNLREHHLDYRLKNDALLSHLFGYEGQGSLLHFWKTRKWATQVIAGIGLNGSNFSDFNLYIELTETGLNQITQIIQSVLYFAELVKTAPETAVHYAEKAQLNELAFQHQPAQNSLDTALHLVKNLTQFPDEELLTAEYYMKGYDASAMHNLLQNIRPSHIRVISISPHYQLKDKPEAQVSPWYQVPYAVAQLDLPDCPADYVNELQVNLHLPLPNNYIPDTKLQLPEADELPSKHHKGGTTIWTGSNTTSAETKGECFLSWRNPTGSGSLQRVAQRKLFCSAMESKLNEHFYPAQLAGIHYNLYSHQSGIGLHTSGFAHKQLMLCRDIVATLQNLPGECPDFELHKQEYLNTLLSSIRNKPLNRLFTALQTLCVSASWLPEDLARVAMATSQNDLQQTHQHLFKNFQLEGMVYGYWSTEHLEDFVKDLNSFNQTGESTQNTLKHNLVNLSQTGFRSLHFPCKHNDAAMVLYLQSPSNNLQEQARTMLAETLLAGFYFNWMRNQKQLGYQAGTGYMPFNEHPGIAMFVQSSTAAPVTLYQETRACMSAFYQWLNSLNDTQWHNYHQSMIRQLDSSNVKFAVRCQRYWSAIGREPMDFEFELHLQQAVAQIQAGSLAQWFKVQFLDSATDFSLYTAGDKAHSDTDFENPLPSIYQFK